MSVKRAKEVLTIESEAIRDLKKRINRNFTHAVELIYRCKGRVIVTGMGKTGIIGHKLAATLSSTGTPSIWMHSAEAIHGDLGQVTKTDVVILITTSGETEETRRLIPLIKKIGVKIIALTGNLRSFVARHSDIVLDISVKKEGCPLGLAPMASTTATLAMGDAMAACLVDRKKFRKEDFARFHPGGSLGRRLLLRVRDIMRTGQYCPRLLPSTKVKTVLLAITKARCGSACIVDREKNLLGIFTDGDLRRHLEVGPQLLNSSVKEFMTRKPKTIDQDRLAAEAFEILQDKKIDELPVVDKKKKCVGLLDVQDILKAGCV